ncbi:hypothetical protein LINPERHAP2_LOCUS17975 [Linum perenne]
MCERYSDGDLGNFPNESGIRPVSLFRSRCRASRLGNRASSLGIDPVSELNERSVKVRDFNWPSQPGTEPVRLRWSSRRKLRRLSLAIAGWIGPVTFVSLRKVRCSRKGRSPIDGGSWPESSPAKMVREMMRLVVRSHSTWYQLVQQSES